MPRSSLSSYATSGTMTANSSLRNEIMATTSNETGASTLAVADLADSTPPSSPSRPPRPHESPLVIPDLVTGPMTPGPPPSQGLPPPPPLSPPPGRSSANVTNSSSLYSLRDPEFAERGAAVALANNANHTRGEHDSWGSWTNSGDDGLGLAVPDAYTNGIGIALTKTHSSEALPGPLDDQGVSNHDI